MIFELLRTVFSLIFCLMTMAFKEMVPRALSQLSAQLLDFGSGHDLMVHFVRLSPLLGSVLTARSLLRIPSLPLSLSPSPYLKINI